MIDVEPSDYLKLYGGMVRVLRAIEQAGPNAGLPSRKLGEDLFNSHTYGSKVLQKAALKGYIVRKKVRKKGESGHYYVMNYLTDKGRKLLRDLGEEV